MHPPTVIEEAGENAGSIGGNEGRQGGKIKRAKSTMSENSRKERKRLGELTATLVKPRKARHEGGDESQGRYSKRGELHN